MERNEVLGLVTQYLVQEFEIDAEEITPEAHLFEELELDSIDALDLAATLTNKLNVTMNEEELKELRTVDDVVEYIMRNLSED